MKIINTMAYAAVAAVAAYNVYLAADVQQVNNDLTFDTIELTASGAEPGGDVGKIIDDSCSPGSPAWYAKMFGDSYGQSGGSFYVGKDPYCENALLDHDNGNKATCSYEDNFSLNSGVNSSSQYNNGHWKYCCTLKGVWTEKSTGRKFQQNSIHYTCVYDTKNPKIECRVGGPDRYRHLIPDLGIEFTDDL